MNICFRSPNLFIVFFTNNYFKIDGLKLTNFIADIEGIEGILESDNPGFDDKLHVIYISWKFINCEIILVDLRINEIPRACENTDIQAAIKSIRIIPKY